MRGACRRAAGRVQGDDDIATTADAERTGTASSPATDASEIVLVTDERTLIARLRGRSASWGAAPKA